VVEIGLGVLENHHPICKVNEKIGDRIKNMLECKKFV
jgi:hypothetical protein